MQSSRPVLLLALLAALAAAAPPQGLFSVLSLRQNSEGGGRFIRDTPGNQQYFDDAQAIVAEGEFEESADCEVAGRDAIIDCVRVCNSPGERRRGQCCCVAEGGDFRIGLAGSCRYKQVVLNYSNSDPPFMEYRSNPPALTAGQGYFDPQSCEPTNQNPGGQPCSCELVWRLDVTAIRQFTPKPTPSVPASPSPKPSDAVAPSPPPSPKPSSVPQPSKQPDGAAVVAPPAEDSSSTPASDAASDSDSREPPAADTDNDLPPPSALDPNATPDSSAVDTDDESAESPAPSDADADADADADGESADADDGGGDICVDASWLAARGARADDLVHTTHRFARVLCPDNGLPCGTRHHAVRDASGTVLSYGALCARADVTCTEDEMHVNSVWSHAWEETRHENGIRLTMFDVRYPGVAQKVLHRVMRALRTVGAA